MENNENMSEIVRFFLLWVGINVVIACALIVTGIEMDRGVGWVIAGFNIFALGLFIKMAYTKYWVSGTPR